MIYIIGIFVAFFLALLIFTKKGRNLADTVLGIWMVVIGTHLLGYYSYASGLVYDYPQFLWLNLPYPFFHGPMLFLYTQALTNPEKLESKAWLFHFILPAFILVIHIPFMLLPTKEIFEILKNGGRNTNDWQSVIHSILLISSGFFYVFTTYRLLSNHKKRILNQFSYQEKISLNWLRLLFYGMGIMWFFIIFISNDTLIFSAATVFTIFIGYYGINQVGIFSNQNTNNESGESIAKEEDDINSERKKYAKSGLNEEMVKAIHQKLTCLMETERVFTQPELNLNDLATRLNIHSNSLSQVINEIEGVNFYDYINSLRIEEFKRLVSLPENQKFTLLGLAYECGFNSKSAFNRIFKKTTGSSPSEYVKSLTEKM